MTDDKFIDSTIELFESISWIDNSYYWVTEIDSSTYIQTSIIKRIKKKNIAKKLLDEKFADVVVLHSLGSLPNDIIAKIDKNIKVVWFSWGGDLYSNIWPEYKLIKIENRIKDSFAKKLYESYRSLFAVKQFLKCSLNGSLFKNNRKTFLNAIKRIDYYSGVFPIEYDLILNNNKSIFRAKKIDFNYTRKIEVHDTDVCNYDAQDILVGNSASCLLNHCNVFERLKSFDLKERRVVVPLSYETENWLYLNHVKRKGRKILGDSFIPIENFMNFDDFCQFLKNCSIGIFDIEQQAATGTISLCIGLGMKVFLPQSSVLYSFYKSIGVRVFSIESELTERELNDILLPSDRISNREIILSYFSYENVLRRVEDSFLFIANEM